MAIIIVGICFSVSVVCLLLLIWVNLFSVGARNMRFCDKYLKEYRKKEWEKLSHKLVTGELR